MRTGHPAWQRHIRSSVCTSGFFPLTGIIVSTVYPQSHSLYKNCSCCCIFYRLDSFNLVSLIHTKWNVFCSRNKPTKLQQSEPSLDIDNITIDLLNLIRVLSQQEVGQLGDGLALSEAKILFGAFQETSMGMNVAPSKRGINPNLQFL